MLNRKRALLFVGSLTTPFAEMKYSKTLKDLNGKIVECKFENKQWIFMRERTDKSYPNAYTTAMCKFLFENISRFTDTNSTIISSGVQLNSKSGYEGKSFRLHR